MNLSDSRQFRCFVRNLRLIGICQRDGCYDPFYHEEAFQRELKTIVNDFFVNKIRPHFRLNSYVMDVYIDPNKRVLLIGLKAFSERTDCILFSWDYLLQLSIPSGLGSSASSSSSSSSILAPVTDLSFECRVLGPGQELGPNAMFAGSGGVCRLPYDLINVADADAIQRGFHLYKWNEEKKEEEKGKDKDKEKRDGTEARTGHEQTTQEKETSQQESKKLQSNKEQ